MRHIGEAIKQARINAGLRQVEFARLCGMTGSGVCAIEKGNREPNMSTLRSILSVLGVTFEELCE